jgi:sarcosine oxidase
MNQRFDVIVIGVGAMGSAACYHLARRGVRVLGLEQFGIPNSLGSAHGDTRMIRLCYYEHPDYVPLLQRAYQLWDELDQRTQQQFLHRTGGIYIGPGDCEFIVQTLRAAREHRLPHRALDHQQLTKEFPQFRVPDDQIGIYEPNAGIHLPERVVAAHAQLELQHGATIHAHEPIMDWQSTREGVMVRSAKQTYFADRIILTGGAWSEKLLGEIGVKLTVTRQALGWVWPKNPAAFSLGTMPVWAINNPDGSIHYGFPMLPALLGRPGFKIAHHFHGEPTTPDEINRAPQPEEETDFRHVLTRFIPEADGPLLSMTVCMYTNTPDSHFIIDHHPRCERAIIACGFSGHGFKFASVIGEVLADLAQHGRSEHPISFLRLSRFAATK